MQGSIGRDGRITTEALTERVVEAAAPTSRCQLFLSFLFFISFHYLLVNLHLHCLLYFDLFVPDTRNLTFVGVTPRTLLRAEHSMILWIRGCDIPVMTSTYIEPSSSEESKSVMMARRNPDFESTAAD